MKRSFLVLIVTTLFFTSCGKEKAFDDNLQKSYSEMTQVVAYSAIMCEKISNTWRTAIFDKRDHNGDYCRDFNDALRTLFTDHSISVVLDSIGTHKNKMTESASLFQIWFQGNKVPEVI